MKQEQEKIISMFDEIAPSYDRANRVLSFGIDSSWRRYAVNKIGDLLASEAACSARAAAAQGAGSAGGAEGAGGGERALKIYDIACGTGDMCELLEKLPGAQVVGVDPSSGMLEVARRRFGCDEVGAGAAAGTDGAEGAGDAHINRYARAREESDLAPGVCSSEKGFSLGAACSSAAGKKRVEFVQASATQIPADDGSVDVLTISYGFRNVVEKEAALAEFARVLRPGGLLCVLEFCPREKGGLIAACRDFYLAKILPFLGGLISHNRAAYEYLPQSIEGFYTPAQFARALAAAGFSLKEQKSFSFGVSYMFLAQKNAVNAECADV